MKTFTPLLGLLVLVGSAVLLSSNRKEIRWRTVGWGLALQLVIALLILKTQIGNTLFVTINDLMIAFLGFSREGARMVFGNLIDNTVVVGPVDATGNVTQLGELAAQVGSFVAFSILPAIIFFSAMMTVLHHLGMIQKITHGFAWVMARTMKTSGRETLCSAANVFVGLVEAPMVVRSYMERMSRSELMSIMTSGFATISGAVMAAYVTMLKGHVPGVAGHLMAASIMSAPAGLVMAKLFVPETERSANLESVTLEDERQTTNIFDALTTGASQGISIAIHVAAMLIAFIATIALVNGLFAWIGGLLGLPELSLSWLFGKLLAPVAFLLGIPWSECGTLGELLGTKLMINEFVAYSNLQNSAVASELSERSRIIGCYALCGFANLSSIGMLLGGMGSMAPSRRQELSQLVLRALLAGAFASFSTACIAAMLI